MRQHQCGYEPKIAIIILLNEPEDAREGITSLEETIQSTYCLDCVNVYSEYRGARPGHTLNALFARAHSNDNDLYVFSLNGPFQFIQTDWVDKLNQAFHCRVSFRNMCMLRMNDIQTDDCQNSGVFCVSRNHIKIFGTDIGVNKGEIEGLPNILNSFYESVGFRTVNDICIICHTRQIQSDVSLLSAMYENQRDKAVQWLRKQKDETALLVDGMVCINLKNRTDRWNTITARFAEEQIEVERVNAITPEDPRAGVLENRKEGACSLSHMDCWKILLRRGYDKLLIFEDDIFFMSGWKEILNNMIRDRNDGFYGSLFLNGSALNEMSLEPNRWHQCTGSYLAGAYVITEVGVKALFQIFNDRKYERADMMTVHLQRATYSYHYFPWLCIQETADSDIQNSTHFRGGQDYIHGVYLPKFGDRYKLPECLTRFVAVPEPPKQITQFHLPVSVGEAIDKWSILMIKKQRIQDEQRLAKVKHEMDCLRNSLKIYIERYPRYVQQLVYINTKIWDAQELYRQRVRDGGNTAELIESIPEVFTDIFEANDARFRIKNYISTAASSDIQEQKSYPHKTLYILSRMGIGDIIIIAPAIRYLSMYYDIIKIICFPKHERLLQEMFSDTPNIKHYVWAPQNNYDSNCNLFLSEIEERFRDTPGELMRVGLCKNYTAMNDNEFHLGMYEDMKVSWEIRWESPFAMLPRNHARERNAAIACVGERIFRERTYIVMHDDDDRIASDERFVHEIGTCAVYNICHSFYDETQTGITKPADMPKWTAFESLIELSLLFENAKKIIVTNSYMWYLCEYLNLSKVEKLIVYTAATTSRCEEHSKHPWEVYHY